MRSFFGFLLEEGEIQSNPAELLTAPHIGSTLPKYLDGASVDQLLSDCLAQIHRNAEIACEKFKWVRAGMFWSFVAVLPWIVALSLLV